MKETIIIKRAIQGQIYAEAVSFPFTDLKIEW